MKTKTKVLIIILIILISCFLSAILSWILVQIFARTPEEILNFNLFKVFDTLVTNIYALQIFVLLLVIFSIFLIFSVLKLFNLNNFLSKTYEVTPDIHIPLPVGKDQTQQGSAWWMDKKRMEKKFGKFTFDPNEGTFDKLLTYSRNNKKTEKEKIENMENETKFNDQIKVLENDFENINKKYSENFFVDNDIFYKKQEEGDED